MAVLFIDNQHHIINSANDFVELIESKLGYDTKEYIQSLIDDLSTLEHELEEADQELEECQNRYYVLESENIKLKNKVKELESGEEKILNDFFKLKSEAVPF